MEKLIQRGETYHMIGICMDVHREFGFGFSEIVYKDALEIEATMNEIPVLREKQYSIIYKGRPLAHKYSVDFVMFNNIIVEVKSSRDGIADAHISQTLNYMKASACSVGLIVNFGKKVLNIRDWFL